MLSLIHVQRVRQNSDLELNKLRISALLLNHNLDVHKVRHRLCFAVRLELLASLTPNEAVELNKLRISALLLTQALDYQNDSHRPCFAVRLETYA